MMTESPSVSDTLLLARKASLLRWGCTPASPATC